MIPELIACAGVLAIAGLAGVPVALIAAAALTLVAAQQALGH